MDIYPGPYCEALKLSCQNIDQRNISVKCDTIKYGLIVEFYGFVIIFMKNIKKLCNISNSNQLKWNLNPPTDGQENKGLRDGGG